MNYTDRQTRAEYVRTLLVDRVRRVRDRDGNVWERKHAGWQHVSGPDYCWTGSRGRWPLHAVERLYGPIHAL